MPQIIFWSIIAVAIALGIPAAKRIHRNYKLRLLADCKDGAHGLLKAIGICRDRWQLKALQKSILRWENDWVEKVDRGEFNRLLDLLNKAWIARREWIRKAA